ncbi:hypothetical protein [Luteipulveratus mongoliensis]|uniref:ATP synthase I n=1 Tax=Luteipulveratus mongoliensis TaxID=571913 RepID=A0A0K1JLC0_9MICO|nr:hypothetical protein [Luteipulveratus mongoliensis]AKU17517.1 hypothetical protein VV02_19505 [Luteipulveratus mongoliensis]
MDSRPRDAARPTKAVAVGDKPFAAMLQAGVLASMVAFPVVVIALWIARDSKGGGSAALGALLAVVFFAAGLLIMGKIVDDNPMTVMAGALAVYLGQIIFLGIVILFLSDASWIDGPAFGIAVLAIALVWQVAQIAAFMRMRKPVYDEPSSADDSTEETS